MRTKKADITVGVFYFRYFLSHQMAIAGIKKKTTFNICQNAIPPTIEKYIIIGDIPVAQTATYKISGTNAVNAQTNNPKIRLIKNARNITR